ncbi:MAG: hypothetical protein ACI4LT_06635 [Treponema sp.]
MAAYFLSFSNVPPFLQYIITGFSAFIGAILLNAAISRIPFLRWCVLGIKKEKNKRNSNGTKCLKKILHRFEKC